MDHKKLEESLSEPMQTPSLLDDYLPPPPYSSDTASAGPSRPKATIPIIGKNEGYPIAPYCPIPSTISAHGTYTLKGLYTFFLCGVTPNDRLYLVETHRGATVKPPLGLRTGAVLHNGLDTHDPIVAATGENDAGVYAYRSKDLNTSSVLIVPDGKGGLKTEVMSGIITADKEVAFRFSMDVGPPGAAHREEFEWIKFTKEKHSEHAGPGYRLFRLEPGVAGSSTSGDSAHTIGRRDSEALAVVTFPSGLMALKISYFFTLKFLKAAEVQFGVSEEWKLMVAMTAVRLVYLRAKGSTNKSVVSHYADKA